MKKKIKNKKSEKHTIVFSKRLLRNGVLRVFVSFCVLVFVRGIFVMVPLNLTYLHCIQHFFFENLFNLNYNDNYYTK